MRPAAAHHALRAALLAGPVAVAFASGGYFEQARLVALLAAWGLVAIALAAGAPVPRGRVAWTALGALAALTGWAALSGTWTPLEDRAADDAQRGLLYLGALLAASLVLADRRSERALEPVLAAGALVVILYGLAGRVAPGTFDLAQSLFGGGRLEQPLTYWNAEGALAAMGLVLCVRLAGEPERSTDLRAAAAAGSVLLLTGLVLSFSRGALAAAGAGLLVVLLLAPTWTQLRALAVALEAGVVASLAAIGFDGVEKLAGDLAAREREGAIFGLVLIAAAGSAATLQVWAARAEGRGGTRLGRLPIPAGGRVAAAVVAVALVAAPAAVAATGGGGRPEQPAFGATTQRLASIGSNRAEYWRVAWRSFARDPVAGAGAGAFAHDWLRERPFAERVRDAHSLPIETLAELGLIGLALLLAFGGAVAAAARSAWRRAPAHTGGACAALATWALHAGLDWDWELPGLTLVAIVLAGGLLARAAPHEGA